MSVLVVGGIFREIFADEDNPRRRMGGSGLTAAIIAARLGVPTTLASYVGREDVDTVHAMLDAAGVDRSSIAILPGASGTFVFPTETADESRPWPLYRPAEAVPIDIPVLPDADVVLVFGIPEFDPIAEGWLRSISDETTLIWDQQGWISRARDSRAAAALSPRSKLYLANLAEARREFPGDSEASTLRALPPPGYQAAIVKRGGDGCTVVDASTVTDIPGFAVEAVSTVGSGDAFAGALAASVARHDLVSAARIANATSAAFLLSNGDPLDPALLDRQSTQLRAVTRHEADGRPAPI